MNSWFRLLAASLLPGITAMGVAQESKQSSTPPTQSASQLEVTKTIKTSETMRVWGSPIECDEHGDIFLKTDIDGFPSIHKIDADGDLVARYAANSCPDIKVQMPDQFTLTPDGRVYQLAFSTDGGRYVLVFKDDGTCHSTIKLDTPFSFSPYELVVFPSGNMIISGLRWVPRARGMVPYTGLFSSSGTVLKEIDLDANPDNPQPSTPPTEDKEANHAVSRGVMQLAADNNVYLMKALSPATVYAISEGGAVVRKFVIDPEDANMLPQGMQVAGNRLALLFYNNQTRRTLMKLMDLEGKEVASYDEPVDKEAKQRLLSLGFACYSSPPDKFTFLTTLEGGNLGLKIAEAR